MNKYIYAIWRRKTASAQIRLFEGSWKNTINGRDIWEYITRQDLFDKVFNPIKIAWLKDKVFFEVKISGSWISAQSEAISHWISRALVLKDESLKTLLKQDGLLTRDARKVERKKPGKKKARKSRSWSKR